MKYHQITCELKKAEGKSWEQMAEELLLSAVDAGQPVRLVFFTACRDKKGYLSRRAFLEQWVEHHFAAPRPVVSLVAQRPLAGEMLMEVHSLKRTDGAEVMIEEREASGVRYLRIAAGNYREIVAGGLCADDIGLPIREQSMQAFGKAEAILKAEQMTFGDVVRQWNYLEDITDVLHGNQCYQDFNDVRTHYYASSEWPSGYPAATGIGAHGGGIQIDFNAVKGDVTILPMDNDWQKAAHVYSDEVLISHREEVGKGTPKFERGKMLSDGQQELIYVSGTAAIRGEKSIGEGDVIVQTKITVENILHLTRHSGGLKILRVYLKNAEDVQAVKEELDTLCPDVPVAYLHADVCREELLVEIEGIANL